MNRSKHILFKFVLSIALVVPSQKRPHRIHTDPQLLRYFLIGAPSSVQGQYSAVIPLRIVKSFSSGSSAQAVAIDAAVQKVNHQSVLQRNHHFVNQNTNHQAVNVDVRFATGDIVQSKPDIRRYTA